jgi:hypothetical protein
MTDATDDWIPDSPGEDPDAVDTEPEQRLGGVDRGDDVAQDLQENLEDGALSTAEPDPVEPPD